MLVDAARREGVGQQLPRRALGRQRQEQHHRLADASAGVPARRRQRAGLRQRDRGHRPRGARPAAAGHDLPVRAQARRGAEDRRELAAARRSARECGAGHHHDACRSSRSSRASCSRWPRSAARAETGRCATRRCAVIIDEAHSSQGGETATDLKEVLGGESTARGGAEVRGRGRPRGHGGAVPQHGQARPAGEPELLRLHRHAEAQDARRLRPRWASRRTATRCGRRSRKSSSSTC